MDLQPLVARVGLVAAHVVAFKLFDVQVGILVILQVALGHELLVAPLPGALVGSIGHLLCLKYIIFT